ncbi:PucR C-terminal helix-turn-helix domain-containing protein [Allokutzneria albata]|uniref:PucR C-terminal helix-turn-helix domain-containing protein n=1 Tax=Allokutzneria albata TaxID=211114 RepID=A0A1H0D5Z2_ALLAB|nr:PucR C-terminal helix-turn-helix domain-containing protein [Allokutzneria albata]
MVERLVAVAAAGGGAGGLAEVVADWLGGVVVITDAEGRELARAGRGRGGQTLKVAAIAHGRRVGEVSRTGEELDGDGRRNLDVAASVIALELLVRAFAFAADERERGQLLADLLAGRPGTRERAQRFGVDLDSPHSVVVLTGPPRLAAAAAHFASAHGGLSVEHEEHVVLLLPGADAADHADRSARVLGAELRKPVTAGAAHGEIAAAYAEARRCLTALLALGGAGRGASAERLGFVGLVLGDEPEPERFVRATIGVLLDHDARRGTSLVPTLRAYFAAGRSPTRAKELLNVHVNTVTQRLERISSLLGPGWQEPERALEVELALRLLDLIRMRTSV